MLLAPVTLNGACPFFILFFIYSRLDCCQRAIFIKLWKRSSLFYTLFYISTAISVEIQATFYSVATVFTVRCPSQWKMKMTWKELEFRIAGSKMKHNFYIFENVLKVLGLFM